LFTRALAPAPLARVNNSQGASLLPPQRLFVFTGAGADWVIFSFAQGCR
jgi:hypothetical protein